MRWLLQLQKCIYFDTENISCEIFKSVKEDVGTVYRNFMNDGISLYPMKHKHSEYLFTPWRSDKITLQTLYEIIRDSGDETLEEQVIILVYVKNRYPDLTVKERKYLLSQIKRRDNEKIRNHGHRPVKLIRTLI